jgi:hypothetical protein
MLTEWTVFTTMFTFVGFIVKFDITLIDKQFQKVDKLEREDLLKYNQQKQSDRVPLVLTYTDGLQSGQFLPQCSHLLGLL